ncbi:MAG: protein-L-isoaspartate O-methyltransferase [Proteobacteria bacterium]|nr:protein-L-isoaspartate O-methyltransferase [Pseudomonadota bacterium]
MEFAEARRRMIDCQLRPSGVRNPAVLAAIAEVPREVFVPRHLRGVAYVDEDIEIGKGRYLMEPLVLARLLEAAELKPTDVALQIGCGTGYTAVVLARLVSTVVAVESDRELVERANALLAELGADNAAVVHAPLADGYPGQAPYDVIFLSGGAARLPERITAQLAEGGRLVGVFVGGDGVGRARVITRQGGMIGSREVFNAATPVLPGFTAETEFVF